ncbi:MAG: DUF2779 domain-containing protein [Candidatus Latescibacteria bacterium]|nr:DUF2779 domain-containing protein [Candidatus Latescibacterota bacterium]
MEQLPLWDVAPPAARMSIPFLSKSRFGAGLQCPKRLYLECYRRDLRDPIDPTTQALFDAGINVGKVARGRFPGGVTFTQGPLEHDEAVRETAAALTRPDTRALYEPAFTHDDVRVRVDILAAAGKGEWDLVEVKSGSGYKEEHLADVGIQLYVLEGAGVRVRRACLLHVNGQYLFEGGAYDLERLFTIRDLTDEARGARSELLEALKAMRRPLREPEPPSIAVGPQCKRPYVCPFYTHCHDGGPEHPVDQLPRTSPKLIEALRAAAIDDIRDIPEDFDGLTDLHKRIRASVITGRVHSDPELKRALEKLEPPIHFLDFETCNPALPLFKGTRPFQQIPFQWSDHVLHADGTLEHREYLHDGSTDPRRMVAGTLLQTLGRRGPIVVYSGFEERIIRSLASVLPDLSADLLPLVETRIVDLLELIRAHYYHPGFKGSFSIKGVLPALVRDLDYEDLEIREGGQAAAAYVELVASATQASRRDEIKSALRAYCRRDTEAMVRLYQKLRGAE